VFLVISPRPPPLHSVVPFGHSHRSYPVRVERLWPTVTIWCPEGPFHRARFTVTPVPIVAAAVCPQPPLLVPELAAGAAAELDDLRAACGQALHRLAETGPDRLVVISSGKDTTQVNMPFHASFAPWGVPVRVGDGGAPLPLGLAVAVWLLHRRGWAADALYTVATDLDPAGCATFGAELASSVDRVALLAMGDGSACRGEKSPGYDDPRAEPYDDTVARALGTADGDALRDLDPVLSAQLHAAGRAPWQVLAGVPAPWRAELFYYAAPYGVAYFVAAWSRP